MRVAVLHASAGHGHTQVAESVREGLLAAGLPAKELIFFDVLDETPAWFKKFYTAGYYHSVKCLPASWGAVFHFSDHPLVYRILGRPLRHWVNNGVGGGLVRRILKEKPDAIINTHFLAPELLGRWKKSGGLSSFLLTVVTDYYPHSFWINPGTDHYWVMSQETKEVLISRGVEAGRITAGGIPIALKFHPKGQKEEIRRREGLDQNRLTLLLTSGSFGLGPLSQVLDGVRDFSEKVQAIVVCGRNEEQKKTLQAKGFPFPVKVYGFVSNMDELMEASDLVVAKPGGSTATESLAKGVPMVVLDPIPGQETGNADLLKARNASFVLGEPSDIRTLLKGIFDYPSVLEEKKRNIARLAKPEASTELAQFIIQQLKPVPS